MRIQQIVFVGCGGTFWYALPILSVLVKRIAPDVVWFSDGDLVNRENQGRQWAWQPVTDDFLGSEAPRSPCVKSTKPDLAAQAFYGARDLELEKSGEKRLLVNPWTREDDTLLFSPSGGFPSELVAFCSPSECRVIVANVDNDATRAEIMRWLPALSNSQPTIYIDSGCDTESGQVKIAVAAGGQFLHDWRKVHPLNLEPKKEGPTCGQDPLSNCSTAMLVGHALAWVQRELVPVLRQTGDAHESSGVKRSASEWFSEAIPTIPVWWWDWDNTLTEVRVWVDNEDTNPGPGEKFYDGGGEGH